MTTSGVDGACLKRPDDSPRAAARGRKKLLNSQEKILTKRQDTSYSDVAGASCPSQTSGVRICISLEATAATAGGSIRRRALGAAATTTTLPFPTTTGFRPRPSLVGAGRRCV